MNYRDEMMKRAGVTSLTKPKTADVIQISREEYNLLDYKDENTIYYIIDPDNTVTMIKGGN